jgi:hypothetical protein
MFMAFVRKPKFILLSQSALMFGGFLMLMCEIRFEHRAVLIDDWRPWVPIVFCALMLLVIPTATVCWDRGGKTVLVGFYLLAATVGVLGMIQHAEGHMIQRLIELVAPWLSSPQAAAAIKANHPPVLAPAAFIGLGSIGALFCANQEVARHEKLTVGET